MNRQKQIDQFAKLSAYMLGRHPEEFGLVPDNDGYLKIKEFIQAITEIDGYRHIRKNHINETMLVHPDPPFEVTETRIRAKDGSMLSRFNVCENLPSLLYTCIKQKSYPSVLDNGILPTAHANVICCKDPDMAQRIGKRRSPQPILLTIHTKNLLKHGTAFIHSEGLIFLADFIPTDCFTGPPLPKEMPAVKKPAKKVDAIETYKKQALGGTFTLKMNKPGEKKSKGKKKEKDDSWKNNKKRQRREKKYSWPDQ